MRAYNKKHLVPTYDQETMFSRTLDEILQLKLKSKLNWIQLYNVCIVPPAQDLAPIPAPPAPNITTQNLSQSTILHLFFQRFSSYYDPNSI